MAEVQKTVEQAEQTSVKKTPEAAAVSAVIGGQPNQEIHGQASSIAHANDKTLSEPDMIAMNDGETVVEYKARVAQIQANRFGFFDSEEEKKSDAGAGVAGKTKIHEHPAKQAIEPLPELSPTIQQLPYDSSVKVNAQITNVPEVPEAVTEEMLARYGTTVLESAAAAVRQVENHLAQPNAINSDLLKIGQWAADLPEHFAQSPEQLNKDVHGIAGAAIDEIDKPLTPDERANMAGMMLPMFFFEGGKEPINPETIEQMGLEGLSEAELKALGIEKRIEILEEEITETRRVLDEKDIVNPIDRNATAQGKLAQLQALSKENEPLAEKFLEEIDTEFGTKSEIHFKKPEEIVNKANRASIKESKEWFDIEHVRDSFRFKTPLDNLNELPKIAEVLKKSDFEIVNPDFEKLLNPKKRGWRVAAIDLRAPNGQIIEYQILPREMNEAGAMEHDVYEQWRNKDVTKLTREEKLLKREADLQAKELYDEAWERYLTRTGQTEETVKKIIEQTKKAVQSE